MIYQMTLTLIQSFSPKKTVQRNEISFFINPFGKGCKLMTLKIVNRQLTQRAADSGYASRFLSFCLALGIFRFEGESTLPPTASNAHR